MEIKNIYLGAWFQRTSLHLKEFYYFLETGESKLSLEKEKLSYLYRELGVKKFSWQEKEFFDRVWAQFDGLEMSFDEDGLILFKKEYQDLKTDCGLLKEFYEKRFSPVINYIYSLGAPLPKELAKLELILPYIIEVYQSDKKEVEKLFSQLGDNIQSTTESPEASLYFGQKFFLFSLKREEFQIEPIVDILIFFREFSAQLNGYLQAHRTIWEKISQVRSREALRFKDFTSIRNSLMEVKQTLSFVEARLSQMEKFIAVRRTWSQNLENTLKSLSIYQFDTLANAQNYMTSLWKMTKDYADSTFNLLTILYQENIQREVDALKLVTIISMVIAFSRLAIFPTQPLLSLKFIGNVLLVFVFAGIFYFGMRYRFRSRKFELR